MGEIRVLLADDHAPFREGLRAILDRQSDMMVVGEAKDGVEATEKACELAPDIVLMDVNMPLRNGLEATCLIAAQNPQMPVIILTMYVEDEHVLGAINAGARGYILKSTPGQELVEAIRTVHQGGSVLDPGAMKTVLQEFRRLADDPKE
jgi:DNA-binding NarL/FixJ family response regulator